MSDKAHEHAPHSWKPYAITLALLLMLTFITVFAAGINFGSPSVNVVIALSIATVKASLVALVFMHLRHDKPINAVIFTSSLIFLGIFLGFTMMDVDSRDTTIHPPNQKVDAKPATPAPAAAPAHGEQPHH
jgi:cytochrome c oxidase subunit 4